MRCTSTPTMVLDVYKRQGVLCHQCSHNGASRWRGLCRLRCSLGKTCRARPSGRQPDCRGAIVYRRCAGGAHRFGGFRAPLHERCSGCLLYTSVLFVVSALSAGLAATSLVGLITDRERFEQMWLIKKSHVILSAIEMVVLATMLIIVSSGSPEGAASVASLVSGQYAPKMCIRDRMWWRRWRCLCPPSSRCSHRLPFLGLRP